MKNSSDSSECIRCLNKSSLRLCIEPRGKKCTIIQVPFFFLKLQLIIKQKDPIQYKYNRSF